MGLDGGGTTREADLPVSSSSYSHSPGLVKRAFSARSILILFAIWTLTQLLGIVAPPLLDDMDALHIQAAREMAARHDYVTLYVDGIRYLDKPPLPYWLSALSFEIFGVHDWAARLPLALSVLALTMYLYAMGSRLWSERAAFYSGCIFVTSIGPYIFTRFFIPDIMLALWITIAADISMRMIASIEAAGRTKLWQTFAFGGTLALAMLTKGLIGLVFPVGILFAFLAFTGKLRYFVRMRPALGALVFLILALPWHILAAIQNPPSGESKGWFWFYFVNEQINRYLNKRIPHDYDKVPLITFWLLLILWVMPWGLYVAGAAHGIWRNRLSRPGWQRFFLLIWALFIPIFFTFSSRQEYYTLPAVPALALLVGWFLAEEEGGSLIARSWARVASWSLFAIGALAGVVCGYFLIVSHPPPPGMELYTALVRNPELYQLSFGHIFDLTSESLGFFRGPLLGTAIGVFAGTSLALWLRLRHRFYAANLSLAAGMCLVLLCVHSAYGRFNPIIGSKQLADTIKGRFRPGDKIVIAGQYSDASSVGFYTGQTMYMLNGRVNNLWYGSLFADAPHRFEDNASFLTLWSGPGRLFVITTKPALEEEIGRLPGAVKIAASSGKAVYSNRASE